MLWAISDYLKYLKQQVLSNPAITLDSESFNDIVVTALTYFKTGSVGDTSRLLYVHRNTVLYRLNRLRQLTAIDWTKPYDTALLVILLNSMSGSSDLDA